MPKLICTIALLLVGVGAGAQPAEEPTSALVVAAGAGDLQEVRRLVRAGRTAPISDNSWRAIQAARQNGHRRVAKVLNAWVDDHIKSGRFYEGVIDGWVQSTREEYGRSREGGRSFRLGLSKDLYTRATLSFYGRLANEEESDHPLFRAATHFDEAEFRRRMEKAAAKLEREFRKRR